MAGNDDLTFRKAEENDIEQLVTLMNSQYLRKKGKDYFLWQYFNSYHLTILICAFINDELIGMFGLQRRFLKNGIKVGQPIDLLIKSQWRGQGVFKQLYQETFRYCNDIDILCVLANFNGKQVSEKVIGCKTLAKIDSLCLDINDYQSQLKLSSLAKNLQIDNNNYLYSFLYSPEIIYWRFESHPDYQYEKIFIDESNWTIIKIFQDPVTGHKYGDIVAINYQDDRVNNLIALLEKSIIEFQSKEAKTITLWAMPHTLLYKLLNDLKFQKLEQERYFCIKVINPDYNYLYDFLNWDLVQSDSEIY
ncbi:MULTISPECIES: hypothetical protein [unclassified Nodularia (in: cyanobacteria)]|uniref:hypothetical protein n=1 Tax=unclassified Nodularia (in: cyanobacteria) TaxID=2656917 RepID=UPI00188134D2|nr:MULTISPECIES: hypothetical protein [unclassified Nodularia (in: cyanobacteria)]MBE9199403.1 hypothetical protein [Nodularia sp. LEGE 06071]MCC2692901.1 hypothetical protein [Nodularia sp. LEGE 04288]